MEPFSSSGLSLLRPQSTFTGQHYFRSTWKQVNICLLSTIEINITILTVISTWLLVTDESAQILAKKRQSLLKLNQHETDPFPQESSDLSGVYVRYFAGGCWAHILRKWALEVQIKLF